MKWILRFLFNWTMPFLLWIEPSFLGRDNKTSGRKVSAFVFMVMIITTTSKILVKDNPTIIHVYLLCVLVCTFLLLQGIITAQNIIDLRKTGDEIKKDVPQP